jgi:putative colanic acid biosynthesis acetyltransferase WcaF
MGNALCARYGNSAGSFFVGGLQSHSIHGDFFGCTYLKRRSRGMPFVHSRARIAIPWKLTLHDRACLGDRADAYLLAEIELGQRATVAPEVNLSAGSDDSSQPGMPLTPTAKITVGADAFIGAGSVVTEDVPSHVFAPGNPSRIFRPR